MTIEEVNKVAGALIRKYDWTTTQLGYGVKITVTDGEKSCSVTITTGESIEAEIKRAIESVDKHEYGELEG